MKKTLNILTTISLVIFILSFAITLVIYYTPFYYSEIERLDIAASSGLPAEEIIANYDAVISYLSIGGADTLVLPSLKISGTAAVHFEDVRAIFVFLQYTFIISFAVSAALIVFSLIKKQISYFKYAFFASAAVTALGAFFTLVIPEQAFLLMHKILFRNDYWLFDEKEDSIITILPEQFFFDSGVMIAALILLFGIASILVYSILKSTDRYTLKRKTVMSPSQKT